MHFGSMTTQRNHIGVLNALKNLIHRLKFLMDTGLHLTHVYDKKSISQSQTIPSKKFDQNTEKNYNKKLLYRKFKKSK